MENRQTVRLFLKISLASVFLYAAVAATLQPNNWIGYIPQFFRNILPGSLLLYGFSFYQLILSIWILTGWKIKFSGTVSALTLLAIIAANSTQLDILFRDFAIFFASLALIFS